MRTWIIIAALGAVSAAEAVAAQQDTARTPAPRRGPSARPAVTPAPARGAMPPLRGRPMDLGMPGIPPMEFEPGDIASMLEGLREIGPMMVEPMELLSADLAPMIAEAAAMVHGAEPMLAQVHEMQSALMGSRLDIAIDGARSMLDGAHMELSGDRLVAFGGSNTEGLSDYPRRAWLQADQADSTYREAREALNREQFQRASQLFRLIHQRSPRSGYAADAIYWDAFALYRSGGESRLREAVQLLDRQAREYPNAETRGSAVTLATRIRGQLAPTSASARRGIDSLARGQGAASACENDDVRIAAINALSQMDAERALPIVRRVLTRRDECSAPLREKAVYVVSQHHPADADVLLLDVVKNDPSPRVRRQAVYYLGQTRSERAIAALEELVRTSDDRDVQERALYSLAENGGARTAEILRGVAERESATESLRSKAIHYLRERRGGDNAAYLRALYPRLTSSRLREQVLNSVGEMGGEDNHRWLMNIAMDTTESSRARGAAIYRLTEARGATTADLSALYDRVRGRDMRERVLYYIAQRRDTAATTKLAEVLRSDAERPVREKALYYLSQREDAGAIDRVIAVAKSDPDREMRRKAVYYLGQSRDPRAMRALEEIIGGQ